MAIPADSHPRDSDAHGSIAHISLRHKKPLPSAPQRSGYLDNVIDLAAVARVAADRLPAKLQFDTLDKLLRWMQWFHDSDAAPKWISWYELLFSYQMCFHRNGASSRHRAITPGRPTASTSPTTSSKHADPGQATCCRSYGCWIQTSNQTTTDPATIASVAG